MYEERKFKIDFNWKSLLIKLGILMLIVFVICFLIFRPRKDNNFISLTNNITSVKDGAIEYFKDNMTLKKIGDYKKVELEELIKNEYIGSQEDKNGSSCLDKESYVYLTKVRDNEFILKINLKCGKNTESQIFYLTNKDFSILADQKPEKPIDKENDTVIVDKEDVTEPDKDSESTNKPSDNKPNNNTENDTVIADKPNTKILRYKHIKYGEWLEGDKKANNIENSTKKVEFYKYCFKDYCVIDRLTNADKYVGYTMTYVRTEIIPTYRYIFVVWSTSNCIKGFINTGIVEYR